MKDSAPADLAEVSAEPQLDLLLAVLNRSHDRLVATLAPLSAEQVAFPSYDDDWSVAQVASHLGSGAEIFGLLLKAGLDGEPAPTAEQFHPVWDRWNAKAPGEQARDAIDADAALLQSLAALSAAQRATWQLSLFGADQDLSGLVRMRVSEHAIHTWDIAVALKPDESVSADAVDVLIDGLEAVVARSGKPVGRELSVQVATDEPVRGFRLELGTDQVSLAAVDRPGAADLRLPAEAFIRLVYGRLDPQHTPALTDVSDVLPVLRRAFPGF